MNNLIKKCPDPFCDAIFHNCKISDKKCKNCGGSIKMISVDTFQKKYVNWYFQYDYLNENYYRPNYNKYIQQELF
jgi:hypothetical protein